jgi:hypothetical protein
MTVDGNFVGGTVDAGNVHTIYGNATVDGTVNAGTLNVGTSGVDKTHNVYGKLDLTKSNVVFNTDFLDLTSNAVAMIGTVDPNDKESNGVEQCHQNPFGVWEGCADITGKQNYFKIGNHMVVYGSFKWDSDEQVSVKFTKKFEVIPIVLMQRIGYIGIGDNVVAQVNPIETSTGFFTIDRPNDYRDTDLFQWVAIGGA